MYDNNSHQLIIDYGSEKLIKLTYDLVTQSKIDYYIQK